MKVVVSLVPGDNSVSDLWMAAFLLPGREVGR